MPSGKQFGCIIFAVIVVLALSAFDRTGAAMRTANQRDALVPGELVPTATMFPVPQIVHWSGNITRIFLSGGGLEVRGAMTPGTVFHAYMPGLQTSPITDGLVAIDGTWLGWSCEYGQRCVPDVLIDKISPIVAP